MKKLICTVEILTLILVSCIACATIVKPAWNQVNEKISFFEKKGFVFELDRLAKHLYKKETIELTIIIPETFKFNKLDNTFSHVLLLNDDIGVDISTHIHSGKKRIIITISTEMAKKSELYFYYKSREKNVTDGTMYVIKISKILDSLKNEK